MPSQDYYFLAAKIDKLSKQVCCLRRNSNVSTTTIIDYGTSYVALTSDDDIEVSGSGTGTTNIDISAIAVGQTIIVSDLDNKAGANDIIINSGVGNTISALGGIAQIYTISTDSESITIKRITTTQFKIQ